MSVNVTGGISHSYTWKMYSGIWIDLLQSFPNGTSYDQKDNVLSIKGFTDVSQSYKCEISVTGNGCNSLVSNSVTVSSIQSSKLKINLSKEVCSGLNTDKIILESYSPNTVYNWNLKSVSQGVSGFISTPNNTSNYLAIQTLTNSSNTVGFVEYSISSSIPSVSNQCSKSDTTFIFNVLPLPSADAGFDTTICLGDSVTLKGKGGNVYEWFPAINLNNSKIASPVAKPSNTTKYSVKVRDINGCENEDNVTVFVKMKPIINFNSQSYTICSGASIDLEVSGGNYYLWLPNTDLSDNQKNKITANPIKNTIYTVIVTDFFGCFSKGEVSVTVNSKLMVDAGIDLSVCTGSEIALNAKGGSSFMWYPATGLSKSTISNPITKVLNTITYRLVSIDKNGCSGSDDITLFASTIPQPLVIGNKEVCKNLQTDYYTSKTTNGYKWYIENGSILSGQGTNRINVKWSNTGSVGKVTLSEFVWNSTCKSISSMDISISNNNAPNVEKIQVKGNDLKSNILICTNENYKIYQWGYENLNTFVENKTCSNDIWCKYNVLDTLNFNYWVYIGNSSSCLTKSYLNLPNYTSVVSKTYTENISVFPNPAKDRLFFSKLVSGNIQIYNILGKLVFDQQIHEINDIDISFLKKGIYVISLNDLKRKIVVE